MNDIPEVKLRIIKCPHCLKDIMLSWDLTIQGVEDNMNNQELRLQLQNFLLWYFKDEIALERYSEEEARKEVSKIVLEYLKKRNNGKD